MSRTPARLGAALLTSALVLVALPAAAHVGVSSPDASRGGFGKAVFRVPTESDDASTTKLVVTLPESTPFAFVTVGSKPGWKVTVDKEKLDEPAEVGEFAVSEVVRTITWESDGDGIPPGEFDEFALSGGPFPDAESISFTAEQTYSDGTVVAWDDEQTGDEEPEHPAPTLTLAAGDGTGHGAAEGDESADEASDDSSELATWLAGGALAVAVAALVVALRQNRRRA